MSLDVTQTRLPGTGNIWLAPVGSTLPAAGSDPTAALDGAFVQIGYIAEDGITISSEPTISEHFALQSVTAIRRARTSQVTGVQADLLEWDGETLIAAFGGGTFTGGSFPTYTFPIAGDALKEYSVVVDLRDGDINDRYVFPRMNSGLETVETVINRENLAVLPLQLKSLASDDDSLWITDGPVIAGS